MGRVEDTIDQLRCVDLFADLETKVLLQIALTGQEVVFGVGEDVVREGESGGWLYVMLEGEAVVTAGGVERARLYGGDYFGEISLLDSEARSATVTATTPVRAFSLASFNFRPLLEEHFEIAEQVILRLCQRLRKLQAPPGG
ncbi:MAG: family transcriptional regulator, cyclic receptor protein [Actinomycetota bacterium]|jgi:CRP-like cAMP-binding protein|nr:family transcriptional regulator, cyclic receptor protein [Actinomycetota bacterium]